MEERDQESDEDRGAVSGLREELARNRTYQDRVEDHGSMHLSESTYLAGRFCQLIGCTHIHAAFDLPRQVPFFNA